MTVRRRWIQGLVAGVVIVIALSAAAILATQTQWFRDWLRGYIVRESSRYLNGQLTIGRLDGDLFHGVELRDVQITLDGQPIVAVSDLHVEYSVSEILSRGIRIKRIRLEDPVVHLQRVDGRWSIGGLVKKEQSEANRSGPGRPITISDIEIANGSLTIDGAIGPSGVRVPKQIDQLNATLVFRYEPVRFTIDVSEMSLRGSDPALAITTLSGSVAVRDDNLYLKEIALKTDESALTVDGVIGKYLSTPVFNLKASSARVTLPEIARVVPALEGIPLQPSFDLAIDGPADRIGITANITSSAGDVSARLAADVARADKSASGTVDVRHLRLRSVLPRLTDQSDITAHLDGRVQSRDLSNLDTLTATFTVSAPHVEAVGYTADSVSGSVRVKGRMLAIDVRGAAYGARATSAGRLDLPSGSSPFAYDLHGHAAGVDLRKLPRRLGVANAASEITTDYHLVGRGTRSVVVDAKLSDSTIAGMHVAEGGTAQFSLADGRIGYAADATVTGADVQRIGNAFGVAAIQADRYKSSLNGHAVMNGRGTSVRELDLQASGTLENSTIAAGHISHLTFDGGFAHDALQVKGDGSFAGVDPAQASGTSSLAGEVAGTFDVDGTIQHVSDGIEVQDIDGTARVTLARSMVGGLAVDAGAVDADIHGGLADIHRLDVTARDLNVHAAGALALNDTAQSNLVVHADSPSLDRLGDLFKRPISGIGRLDATVTGNRRDLQATGTFTGDGVKYQNYSALTLTTNYTVNVADLSLASAKATATTNATLVDVGGVHLNELAAKTDYNDGQIVFDATARQPERSASATGSVKIDTGRNQVVFDRFTVQSGNMKWDTPAEPRATIRVAGEAVTVTDFTIVSGQQEVSAAGTFGRPGDTLKVALRNVDLAAVDALMLQPLQFVGTLNGSAEIGGTKAAPTVAGMFDVQRGTFRKVPYDSLTAKVSYAGRGMQIDARLEQTPTNWIEAKGYVPRTALAAASGTQGTRDHHDAPSREDAFDLHLDSSPISIALLAGLTSELSNVTGTTEVHVGVTGAGDDPHPQGSIKVQEAGFTVAVSGVKYAHVNGSVDLEPDRVHITDLEVLDNQNAALSITGDLALHQQQVGSVNININTRDFKVIDNKFGSVRIDSDLQITGELTAPRIEGELAVNTGALNLDSIVAATADSAYSERSLTEIAAAATTVSVEPAKRSPFSALEMDVHFTMPDDLVIKSSDLQASEAPIGLGAVNVTVGGDLRIQKNRGNERVRVVGTVTTVRGTYDFQGRRFTILRDGTIRFDGTDEIDPDLNVSAQRTIQGVEANVLVLGTLRIPQIMLSSVPPLEEADILSLIVFNQPVNSLMTGQQAALTQRAGEFAAGTVVGMLGNSLGKALNLTEFNIQTTNDVGNVAQVTAGQQVGQNLYVKVEQGFGAANTTNFVLEYELSKWLRLRTNLLQGASAQPDLFQRAQGSGVDLLFFFRH